MKDLKLMFLRLAMRNHDLSFLSQHTGPDYIVYTIPGYTIGQCLRWKMPVIVSSHWTIIGLDTLVTRYKDGWYYGLVGDANDVAGISELANYR